MHIHRRSFIGSRAAASISIPFRSLAQRQSASNAVESIVRIQGDNID